MTSGTGRRWSRFCVCRLARHSRRLLPGREHDGASKFAVFRYVQLPKLRGVLTDRGLLRFMDSFMIYTEPFVLTGGGPGNATTFLSQYRRKGGWPIRPGPAAASLIYF